MSRDYPTIGTEKEVIRHYGVSTPCFDLHPNQIQPSHIVITSPWFNTKPNNISKSAKPRHEDLQRRREKILRLKEEGYTHAEIGRFMGIEGSNVCQIIARWKNE